jgi:hypothetical protein
MQEPRVSCVSGTLDAAAAVAAALSRGIDAAAAQLLPCQAASMLQPRGSCPVTWHRCCSRAAAALPRGIDAAAAVAAALSRGIDAAAARQLPGQAASMLRLQWQLWQSAEML